MFITKFLSQNPSLIYIYIVAALFILSFLLKIRQLFRVKKLANGAIEVTPSEFFTLKKNSQTFPGVYLLYNHTKKMYYIGQSKSVYSRVNRHFTGHGNGDVYADYKYGDEFTIRLIALKGSGFKTLNELERNAIAAYRAYDKGYNKTRGNKG